MVDLHIKRILILNSCSIAVEESFSIGQHRPRRIIRWGQQGENILCSVAEARRINDAIRWKRGAGSVGRIVGRWIKNGTRQASKIAVANSGSWNRRHKGIAFDGARSLVVRKP